MKILFVLLAAMLTFATTAHAQIGSLAADLVFTPVAPCRILDTRVSQGGSGPIAAGGTKNFVIWGASSYAGQGGAASNCSITAGNNTAAVAVNLTVVTPTTGGFITAYPTGTAPPLAATVNFNAGDVRGNFAILKNAQTSAPHLTVFSTSNVEVVGDVVGYYSKPVATALECQNTANASVSGIAPGENGSVEAPACAAGYIQTATNCVTTSWLMPLVFFSDGRCSARNNDGVSRTISASRTCCRIPGR